MFAAAFAALLLGLVHPFCGVTYAGGTVHHASTASPGTGDGLPETCCSDAKGGPLLKHSDLPVLSVAGGAPVAAAVSWVRLPVSSRANTAARTTLALLPERSYYARSARILR